MPTNFNELIGEDVLILSTVLDPDLPKKVRVHGIDYGGVWIESQEHTDHLLKSVRKTMLEGTPLIYVPFWRIQLAICGLDVPAISSEGISSEQR